jgi:type 1 fimbria pilin
MEGNMVSSRTAPTRFTVSFNPKSTDIDNTSLGTLKVASGTGTATGVAIALFQNDKLINIQNSQPAVTGEIAGGKGLMNLRAMYVRNGTANITPGTANASLPFTLRYE